MEELIKSAYRKTRSLIYYDRGNLHRRGQALPFDILNTEALCFFTKSIGET